jgi:hypothetical protein
VTEAEDEEAVVEVLGVLIRIGRNRIAQGKQAHDKSAHQADDHHTGKCIR